ncbi:hypothetical protein DRO97_02795 [Archaeoglobales archaeon]|nr:MAG: hypothetical protein DRO97_02795 [Archaeoglobales archaeon]
MEENRETKEERIERLHKQKQERITRISALDRAIKTFDTLPDKPKAMNEVVTDILTLADFYYQWLSGKEIKGEMEELLDKIDTLIQKNLARERERLKIEIIQSLKKKKE